MKYYIIEHDIRPDEEVNISETMRSTFQSALSFYYERCSKMVVTDLFTSVHLMLVNENLEVIMQNDLDTMYGK